jgi:hypothetical protein
LSAVLPVKELLREVIELAECTENTRARARTFRIVQKVPESVHVFRGFVRVENVLSKKLRRVCVWE